MKRRWILWLLVVGFLWVVVTRLTEIEKLAVTLARGQWQWVLAAALLQGIYILVFSASYQAAFAAVEIQSRLLNLVPVTLGSLFVNVVAPAGGAGGAALFVDDAARRGHSPARAASATLLQLMADFGAFTFILVVGLGYLFLQHDLKVYELIAALLLLLIVLGLAGVLGLGLWRADLLQRLLVGLQRAVLGLGRRLGRTMLLPEDWAERSAADFTAAAGAIHDHPGRLARTLATAFAAHLLDLGCLFLLFQAFGQPVRFGVLVAGYAMGILFWIVSITPQGIGVVEGVMALVFTSLGVPAEIATTVALAFRGLTFWLPLILGFFLLRRVKTFGAGEKSLAENWGVRFIALLTGLMGLVNVLSSLTPSLADRVRLLQGISPLQVRRGGHLTAALAGFALLLLAASLWRRKRAAWLLTLVVLVVSAASHLLKGLDYEEAALAGALVVILVALRPQFHARSDPPSVRQGLVTLAAALVFTLVYGTAGFYLLDRHFRVNFGLDAAMRQTVVMFTQFYDPGLQPVTGFGRYFAGSIYLVGLVTLTYSLFMLIRPVLVRQPASPAERDRARAIVEAYGRSSLARLTLMDDKSYFFSPAGSVIAYVVRGRVALALGDVIGPPDDLAPAIASFRDLCVRNDWQPAFYQILPDNLETYHAADFESLCIGQEGIVELAEFSLEGRANKGLRTSDHRLARLDYSVQIAEPPLPGELMEQLRQISDEWLASMHGSEKRFSLGWFEDEYIRQGPVIFVMGPQGTIMAFANILPEYQLREITIDLMRHRRQVEAGTMDFLFIKLFSWACDQGYFSVNLGMSPLYGIGERPQDPSVEKALHFIYEHVNQFYNFKGLHYFKEKFHPHWSPRYLAYPNTASLPAVALALAQADTGEGLLASLRR